MSNNITQEQVDKVFIEAEKEVQTVFDKCTVMVCKLKNGFVLTGSAACVDAENYDLDLGTRICEERIKGKIWEMEGYKLQCELQGGDED